MSISLFPTQSARASRKTARKPRESWRETKCGLKAFFQYLIPAPGIPYDWSITSIRTRQIQRIHIACVGNPLTAHFDILGTGYYLSPGGGEDLG